MAEKKIYGRAIQKHDVEANWLKATNFIPMQGEIIVYDIDENYNYERIKIGDGVQNVNVLPFTVVQSDWSINDENDLAYILNRTHYENSTVSRSTELLADASHTFETYSSEALRTTSIYDGNLAACSLGDCVEVVIDGVSYFGTAKDVFGNNGSPFYVGNAYLYDTTSENTNEVFYYDEAAGFFYIDESFGAGSHTIAMYKTEVTSVIKQLDEKFIPDIIARASDVEAIQSLVGDKSVSEQIDEAISDTITDISASGQDLSYTKNNGDSGLIALITTGVKVQDRGNKYHYVIEMYNGKIVSSCCTTSISVTTMPTQTSYAEGDVFNPEGMVIVATCEDGSEKIITDYTYADSVESSPFEIAYIEAGNTYTTSIDITVTPFDPTVQLVDFKYTDNGDGTYTITDWKGTLNGETSTKLVVPNSSRVIV